MGDVEKAFDINLTSFSELTASLMEQLRKAFVELEASKLAPTEEVRWNKVEEHFHLLESRLKKELEELEAKEKVVAERISSNRMLLAESEAEVIAKEQDMLDKAQELKDVALASIAEARANYKPESLGSFNGGNKVSSSTDDENPTLVGENAEGSALEVNPCAELTQFCEKMDSKGLRKFVTENLKNLSDVCKEQLSVVLGSASDPSRLVLDALEGIFPPKEITKEGGNGDAAIIGERKSCLILMEALSTFLSKADLSTNDYLNPETKQNALAIANEWKPKLAEESIDAANVNSLEAEGFLRLLVTFRIASEFNAEELCKFVLSVAHHKQATELCRSLELTQKIPGIIETLIGSERQIDAVHFIHAFQLSYTYSTIPLLKVYLREVRRNCQGTGNADLQNDYNARELAAVKAVIECVEDYNLDDDYPLDPLYRRVGQLDKSSRGDKKRTRPKTTTVKQQPEQKRQRHSAPRVRGRRGPLPLPYYSHPVVSPYTLPGLTVTNTSQAPYGYYGQQGQPRDVYTAASPAPSYAPYSQSSHYPYA